MRAKPYRLCAFYDSETTNYHTFDDVSAFPVVHQLGVFAGADLRSLTPDNVADRLEIGIYRHTFEVCAALEELPNRFPGCVPVVAIHNLGFDMWGLSGWIAEKSTKVLAKSSAKPITITILDEDGNPALVLWDTLGLSMKSLEKMGDDCGFAKAKGFWDYTKVRTPSTPLTAQEIEYAKRDIYVLACWFAWFLRRNPQIEVSQLGINIVTKTGVVRDKRKKLLSHVKADGCKYTVGQFWHYLNKREQPGTDGELFTMNACTRGGLTFCASRWASVPIVCDELHTVTGYDATSQHPGQQASHLYPTRFKEAPADRIAKYARIISNKKLDDVLARWFCPFPFAFNAIFEFDNIRLKSDSVFEREGIGCLAWARFGKYRPDPDTDNESGDIFKSYISERDYKDTATGAVYSFGKLTSADNARLFLTELEFWNVCQVYEFDSWQCIGGYASTHYERPTDLSLLSVMHFYKAKDIYKAALHTYEKTGRVHDTRELRKYAPDSVCEGMERGTLTLRDARAAYMIIKSDLNSLFGIEATNESRLDAEIGAHGIQWAGVPGIGNLPKNPKAWYQYGQRIVGWSRVAQVCVMMLAAPHVDGIPNGDTDSCKFYMLKSKLPALDRELNRLGRAIDKARAYVCSRVEKQYPELFYRLDKIGHYVQEFSVSEYCAAWNKAYMMRDDGRFSIVLAGIPSDKRTKTASGDYLQDSYEDFAAALASNGYTFGEICDLLLGYNVHLSPTITKTNGRRAPEWAQIYYKDVTDYQGNTVKVAECSAMALYNMPKIIGGMHQGDNAVNYAIASANRPSVNRAPVLLEWHEGRAHVVKLLDEVNNG